MNVQGGPCGRGIDFDEGISMNYTTDILAYNDTLGNGQKCRYKQGVTVMSHSLDKVDPIEAKKCHCSYTVSLKVGKYAQYGL